MKTTSTDFITQLYSMKDCLRRFAIHFTKNNEDADDLVQDTLLKAIRYSAKFETGSNLKSWLYMILKNTFINNYRRSHRMNNFRIEKLRQLENNLGNNSSRNLGESKCILNDIYKILENLPQEYYYPFIKYFEGYKYHEIADELCIPIGTVKTRIHSARGMLKKNLKPYGSKLLISEI